MDIVDLYFKDHKYPLVSHQLDSYREFLRTHIPNIICSNNPISMIKTVNDKTVLKIEIEIGYKGKIYIDRPIINENNKDILLTPNEARLRNLTYQTNIYADVKFNFYDNDNFDDPVKFKDESDTLFKKMYIGSVPIMLHSDACILYDNSKNVLKEMNECSYDYGGYFILDGKEKVIISQERITKNRLFLQKLDEDDDFSHKGYISCIAEKGEGSLYPKRFEMKMWRKPTKMEYIDRTSNKFMQNKLNFDDVINVLPIEKYYQAGSTVFNMAKIGIDIPIICLFNFLGILTDYDIYVIIFGNPDEHSIEQKNKYEEFLRPCIVVANKFTDFDKNFDLVEYILNNNKSNIKSKPIINGILNLDLFPNIDNWDGKVKYLGYLIKQFAYFTFGYLNETDKDSYFYKRIDVSGIMLAELYNETYAKFIKEIRNKIDKKYNYSSIIDISKISDPDQNIKMYQKFMGSNDDIRRLIPSIYMSETFVKSLKGKWGLSDSNPDDCEEGKVQDLSRISYLGYLSHVRRVNIDIDRSLKLFKSHMLHSHQFGIICPYETPDGDAIGYLKNLALLAKITAGTGQDDIMECLIDSGIFVDLESCSSKIINKVKTTLIFLNGTLIGITHKPILLNRFLKACKKTGSINILIGIILDRLNNEIRILTESGRAMRPLLVVNNKKIVKLNKNSNWFEFLLGTYHTDIEHNEEIYTRNGYKSPFIKNKDLEIVIKEMENNCGTIEYIDVEESDVSYIAMDPNSINNLHTHCEIHPSTMLSVVSVNIPMCNHSFAARNIFHASQSKQAIGIYATNFKDRFDTAGYLLHYSQKPIITTKPSYLTQSEAMPNGTNIIVAVMAYSGFNQEDSLMINRGTIERSFEEISSFKSVSLTISNKEVNEFKYFCNPLDLLKKGIVVKGFKKKANYSYLDENGFIKKGIYIPPNTDVIVIGAILERTVIKNVTKGLSSRTVSEKEYVDISVMTDISAYGIIDDVYVSSRTLTNKDKICKVRFLKIKQPEIGDKHSSRHGQKGVIGRVFDEEDMPYTKDGLKPDIIMNSHAFPSRMTIGHIVESVYAKLCCLKGLQGDGTVFIPFNREQMQDDLQQLGFERNGTEIMYNGLTGEQIKSEIFIGPVYYFRLKHMVSDKINARGHGAFAPKEPLTRQPTHGRRKSGGLRLGEMERDVLLGHGVSTFIKESYMERADKFSMIIDSHEGTPINKPTNNMVQVNIPYSFKLLSQELNTMGLDMKYNTVNSIDNNTINSIEKFGDDVDDDDTIDVEYSTYDEKLYKEFMSHKIKKKIKGGEINDFQELDILDPSENEYIIEESMEEEHVEEPMEQSMEQSMEESVEQSMEESVEDSMEESVEESVEESEPELMEQSMEDSEQSEQEPMEQSMENSKQSDQELIKESDTLNTKTTERSERTERSVQDENTIKETEDMDDIEGIEDIDKNFEDIDKDFTNGGNINDFIDSMNNKSEKDESTTDNIIIELK
jgi:DNA-directed RNA polymerase II subunit RPB2